MEETKKKIGNVIIDYALYPGKDMYSDGSIEDKILEAVISEKADRLLHNSNEWAVLYHLSDIRKNAIEWCNIDSESSVLEIGSGCGAITSVLAEKAKCVTCVELSEKRSLINAERNKDKDNIEILLGNFQAIEPLLGKYDVVTLIGVLEYANLYIQSNNPYVELLTLAKQHLYPEGKLIIAIENKMGIKYLNGAPEDHFGQPYIGINDYINRDGIRTFSSTEIDKMLSEAGLKERRFYYPVPDYKLPTCVFSNEYLPKPGNVRTYKTNYSQTRIYNFYEDVANDQIAYDGMFGYLANSFVIITGEQPEEDVIFVKYNRERKEEFQSSTLIKKTGAGIKVVKSPLSKKANKHIVEIKKNEEKWYSSSKEINKTKGILVDGNYISDFIRGKTIDEIMYEYRNQLESFVSNSKKYIDSCFSFDHNELVLFEKTTEFNIVFGNVEIENTYSYKITNIDMIFSNIIIDENGKFNVIDFEWVFDFPIPYRYVAWRAAKDLYYKYMVYLKNRISIQKYYQELGFAKREVEEYNEMEKGFGEYVCGHNRSEEYLAKYVKSSVMPSLVIV